MALLRSRQLVLTAWDVLPDGSVRAVVTCRVCREGFPVAFAPSMDTGAAFSEHLALVAATFTLAFENRAIEAGRPRLHTHPPVPD